MISFQGKRVLVMGLGLLGGGVATTRWLAKQGAIVTVTDLKTKKQLAPSLKELGKDAKKVRFVLGGHKEEDFLKNDIVVVNPGVPRTSPFLEIARNEGKTLTNEALIFFETLPKSNPIIAVTGTKGKTTTTNWIALLLRKRWPKIRPAGNTPENPLLYEIGRLKKFPGTPAVLELSSWQLEYLPKSRRAPDIAIITNIYPDHLNRYVSFREYAAAKANIFKNQTGRQITLVDETADVRLFSYLEQAKSKKIIFSDALTTPKGMSIGKDVFISSEKENRFLCSLGEHNVANFAGALFVAYFASRNFGQGKPLDSIEVQAVLPKLGSVLPEFRQEMVFHGKDIEVVNDSASTSPEAGRVALERFAARAIERKLPLFFIMGGTDKRLAYNKLVSGLKNGSALLSSHGLGFYLFLLEGSATEKIKKGLGRLLFEEFESLESLMMGVKNKVKKTMGGIIVFSPSAASFEKFKNEFDRGAQFNKLIRGLANL